MILFGRAKEEILPIWVIKDSIVWLSGVILPNVLGILVIHNGIPIMQPVFPARGVHVPHGHGLNLPYRCLCPGGMALKVTFCLRVCLRVEMRGAPGTVAAVVVVVVVVVLSSL